MVKQVVKPKSNRVFKRRKVEIPLDEMIAQARNAQAREQTSRARE